MNRHECQSNAAPLNAPQPVKVRALVSGMARGRKPDLHPTSERLRGLGEKPIRSGQPGRASETASAGGLIRGKACGRKAARKYFAQ
jgi:hypothetical protein